MRAIKGLTALDGESVKILIGKYIFIGQNNVKLLLSYYGYKVLAHLHIMR